MDEYLQNNLKDIIKQAIWDPYTLVLRKHSQEDKWQEVPYYDLVEDNVIYDYTYKIVTKSKSFVITFIKKHD